MYAPSNPPSDDEENTLQPPEREGRRRESTTHSRRGSADLIGCGSLQQLSPSLPPTGPSTGLYFAPLGPEDVYDVFDLELTLTPGGKESGLDARYRSSDSSSGRPTYKIQKKTRAHFLGKKNMSVEVTRSLGWDSTTATPTLNGAKGYTGVFAARDQHSRSVALSATNSVLCKTALGGTVAVSSSCGTYDPSRAPRHESAAHHFFTLKLNEMGEPESPPASAQKPKRAGPPPPPVPSQPKPYVGGGHFVLDSAPRGRTDLLSTVYCTGYEQRPGPRAGDIVVAELRVRPAGPGAPPAWARFFKERHAALHIARRGLEACMTGPHVVMRVAGVEVTAGRRAVLARGQALEVVLAALGTALLAIEHDGLEAKHWAWLVHPQQASQPQPQRALRPELALGPVPVPAADDNPGLASPGESTDVCSDDSQGASSSLAFERDGGPRTPASGLFVGSEGYMPSLKERRSFADGRSVRSVGSGIELDEWIAAEDQGKPMQHTAVGTPPHQSPTEAPRNRVPPRKSSNLSQRSDHSGTWTRQNSIASTVPEHGEVPEPEAARAGPPLRGPPLEAQHHHLKAGSHSQKNLQSTVPFESLVAPVPEPKAPTSSRQGNGWADAHAQNAGGGPRALTTAQHSY